MSLKITSFIRPLLLVSAAVFIAFVTHERQYVVGGCIGVLAAWLNYSVLISRVKRDRVGSSRNRLTFQFFWRYLLIGILLFALQIRGSHHLIGFVAGFAISYTSFLIEYLIRLRKPTIMR